MISTKSSIKDVELFLETMRLALDTKPFIPVCRKKNMQTLAQLGITWADAKDRIRELTYQDYISGPDDDYDPSELDPFWKFKKIIDGELIYIKIKICYNMNGEVKVVSFHFDNM